MDGSNCGSTRGSAGRLGLWELDMGVVSDFGTGRFDSATGCLTWHDGGSSMYLSLKTIQEALAGLQNVHPFFGVTFLVCKQADLPVGATKPFPLQSAEIDFIERYY